MAAVRSISHTHIIAMSSSDNITIGYHCSHEQFTPSSLVRLAQRAEQAGFTSALSSDHFHPWSESQGQSGFAWSFLGAAMQATQLPFGVVCAPGQRYHPAIIAQAAATLAEMFPERFWVALGSGQAVNEAITGEGWPAKQLRNQRLVECVEVIRALWDGETVTHHGMITVEEAKLYTRPEKPPMIVGAAVTAETAEWVGTWADALITISRPADEQRKVIDAFREHGDGKPMFVKAQISYDRTEEAAIRGAHEQWRVNIFENSVLTDLRNPAQFDTLGAHVQPEELEGKIRMSADVQRHLDWIAEDLELGFTGIMLHNVNREQEQFIDTFGEKVLPQFSTR
jgi:coenzyme F420-dependent glucose-6-phosphate dehydrogenase